MSWPIGVMVGTHVEVVGVEDDPDGGVRIYLTHRNRGLYYSIPEGADAQRARDAWAGSAGHITMPTPPPEYIFSEDEATAA